MDGEYKTPVTKAPSSSVVKPRLEYGSSQVRSPYHITFHKRYHLPLCNITLQKHKNTQEHKKGGVPEAGEGVPAIEGVSYFRS